MENAFSRIYRKYNKHKYLRVVKYYSDKSSKISYHNTDSYKPDFLINPNHIYLYDGYRTVLTSDRASESIDPLDFTSKYDTKLFKTAIESKLIDETFTSLKSNKLELTTLLMIFNLLIGIVIIYLLLKSNGVL